MPKWLVYSLVSILIWGFWGVLPKATSPGFPPMLMQIISTLGLIPVALLLLVCRRVKIDGSLRGMTYAFLTGVCGSVGNLALLEALKGGGEVSTILPLTGMFPLVTVILAMMVLKERPNAVQTLGIISALAALYFFNAPTQATLESNVVPWWNGSLSSWMVYALSALTLFGIAGVTQKLASDISSELSTVCFSAAFVPVAAAAILFTHRLDWHVSGKDWSLAVAYGMLMGFAMVAQFAAYRRGKASVVTAVTALYPALTVALAVPLLGEHPDVRKLVAIALALSSGAALSHEGEKVPVAMR